MRNAQQILKITYGLLPIAAGLDKFTNLLTDWKQYLSASMVNMLPVTATTSMMMVGIIEIIAGIIVFALPAAGGFIVMAWLIIVAITLVIGGHYFDVAVRDIVMAAGGLCVGVAIEKNNSSRLKSIKQKT